MKCYKKKCIKSCTFGEKSMLWWKSLGQSFHFRIASVTSAIWLLVETKVKETEIWQDWALASLWLNCPLVFRFCWSESKMANLCSFSSMQMCTKWIPDGCSSRASGCSHLHHVGLSHWSKESEHKFCLP